MNRGEKYTALRKDIDGQAAFNLSVSNRGVHKGQDFQLSTYGAYSQR